MLRWMSCALLTIALLLPVSTYARELRQPWQILIDSVTYLRGLPEVAWVRVEGHHVLIGWTEPPRRFRAINLTAAKYASRALPKEEVHIVSLRANQDEWHPGSDEPSLCTTAAIKGEIIKTNC
ncbi:exported hypothetical protein [Nitrospina gracilis 3/211]|uniref:Uncharacterized protein n=1 Tax=Nitrospina gracilis (strain 3/211) TaxID=1266370 RepID=M1YVI1_NITG3|nr:MULTISPECIES: hypothetical protein [Nitrospina]MCF8722125.1 hypothetical protein [Nitrospina sp. Nb-3]CCQ89315.1 exported hypothetical protein [Nitrospina gracilis 3/211]